MLREKGVVCAGFFFSLLDIGEDGWWGVRWKGLWYWWFFEIVFKVVEERKKTDVGF